VTVTVPANEYSQITTKKHAIDTTGDAIQLPHGKVIGFSDILELKIWITLFTAPKLSIAILLLPELANRQVVRQASKMRDASEYKVGLV
jgi:hypothetical protein